MGNLTIYKFYNNKENKLEFLFKKKNVQIFGSYSRLCFEHQ